MPARILKALDNLGSAILAVVALVISILAAALAGLGLCLAKLSDFLIKK